MHLCLLQHKGILNNFTSPFTSLNLEFYYPNLGPRHLTPSILYHTTEVFRSLRRIWGAQGCIVCHERKNSSNMKSMEKSDGNALKLNSVVWRVFKEYVRREQCLLKQLYLIGPQNSERKYLYLERTNSTENEFVLH